VQGRESGWKRCSGCIKENGVGALVLAESESNKREDGRSQNGGRFGLSLANRGEVAGYGR
jgi:hypothetical protein